MNAAWYNVLSSAYSYLCAVLSVLILFHIVRKCTSNLSLHKRAAKQEPGLGSAATLRVLSAGNRHLEAGQLLYVPNEGTMGASRSCDVVIPYRKVHLRSAFFWTEKEKLHIVPLHRDGFSADDVPFGAGDEAVLEDGAILRVGELKMVLRMGRHLSGKVKEPDVGPYVTKARKKDARRGRGEGIGARGKRQETAGKHGRSRNKPEE